MTRPPCLKTEEPPSLLRAGFAFLLQKASMHSNARDTNLQAAGSPEAQPPSSGKLAWNTPAMEEVPFTRTEAGGAGAVYDFVVYSGSS